MFAATWWEMVMLSRRAFLRRLPRWGLGALATGLVLQDLGCSGPPSPAPTAAPATPKSLAEPPATPSATPLASQKSAAAATPSAAPASSAGRVPTPAPTPGQTYLAVARGESPADITRAVVAALGGMGRFVEPGQDVVVKPNICVAYHSFEYAATTNPEVVAAVVAMCREAGAKRVRVMDYPFGGSAEQAYVRSGIKKAVEAAGGEMEVMARMKYRETAIPSGRDLKKWAVYQDALKADVLINVPIAKHHSLARLTLGMKNLMGLILDRNSIHSNIGQRVADLASLLTPTLTIVDAVRILTRNGPTGGSLDDVKKLDTVIASHDFVAADAYAVTLFGLKPDDIDYIRAGAAMDLGKLDLKNIRTEQIQI
ncbi:MAG: DUF362 domain-containing protein [Chloroflexi bacterium]|nr:DUF362 domain-containing protein [Chloroflexota bacterium]